jgi:hypothetical protein
MNNRQVEENCVFRKNDGNKYKQTADGKLHCHQNITKNKNNLHEVSFIWQNNKNTLSIFEFI